MSGIKNTLDLKIYPSTFLNGNMHIQTCHDEYEGIKKFRSNITTRLTIDRHRTRRDFKNRLQFKWECR